MVWFGVPREMLVLFDFGPRETYFPPKLAYASRGGTTALEAYQRLSRAEIPRETLKTMTWLYKDNDEFDDEDSGDGGNDSGGDDDELEET